MSCKKELHHYLHFTGEKPEARWGYVLARACCAKSLSLVWLFATSWTIAHQAPLSMGFSRQESWSGSHALLQETFLTRGLNLCLLGFLRFRQILFRWATRGALIVNQLTHIAHHLVDTDWNSLPSSPSTNTTTHLRKLRENFEAETAFDLDLEF